MRLSLLQNATDKDPEGWEISWADLVLDLCSSHKSVPLVPPETTDPKLIKEAEEEVKKGQQAFIPASFSGARKNANVETLYLGVVDVDQITQEEFKQVLAHLYSSQIEAIVYSGWSNGLFPGKVSARIITPFTTPVGAHDWPIVWPRMVAALGGKADPTCKEPARLYFLPACPSYRIQHAFRFHIKGKPLDVSALLTTALPLAPLIPSIRREVDRQELVNLQRQMKSRPVVSNALRRLLDGEKWAADGLADDALFQTMSAIAEYIPDIDPASLLPHFNASISLYPEPTKEALKVIDKYNRLVEKVVIAADAKAVGVFSSRKARISETFRGRRVTPYTSEEEATVDPHEWIVQYQTSWYIYVVPGIGIDGTPYKGGYIGPYGLHTATPAAHTLLSPSSLRLTELTLSGDLIDKDIKTLTREYGSVASGLVLDMTQERATYDRATAILVEAPCPKRKITPKFSVGVDTWLRLLAGTKYEKLEQWLAFSTSLDLPCSALFLEGDPGAGKSLLATGLSYLYTTNGPCALSQVMGNFNQSLSECPIVFADETAPTDMRGKARTAELREIIQATSRHYTRKNLPAGTLKGACRILIAANNAKIFEGEDTLTPADIEAITGRILHIKVGPKAAKYLTREGWAQGQGREEEIAAHVTWLTLHAFKPVSPPRFLVSDAADLARAIATSTTLGSAVAHYLVAALLNKCQRLRANPPDSTAHLLRVIGGRLYVSPRCLIEYWKAYETNVPAAQATSKRVTAGLHGFSNGPEEVGSGVFYQIRVEDLVAWAQSTGMATGEELRLSMVALEDIGAAKSQALQVGLH